MPAVRWNALLGVTANHWHDKSLNAHICNQPSDGTCDGPRNRKLNSSYDAQRNRRCSPDRQPGYPTFLPHEAHATTESGLRMHLRKRVIAGCLQ